MAERAGWRMAGAALRPLLSMAALVALYYAVPLDEKVDAGTVVVWCVSLLGAVALTAWHIRAIGRARYPVLRGVQALTVTVTVFVLLFAAAYHVMSHQNPGEFSESLTKTDALYFTMSTLSTVGFGDITAQTQAARLVVTVQMLADLAVLGGAVRLIVGAVQRGREGARRAEG